LFSSRLSEPDTAFNFTRSAAGFSRLQRAASPAPAGDASTRREPVGGVRPVRLGKTEPHGELPGAHGEGCQILAELKRRNVIRVAGLYTVVGWLLAQVASLLEEALGLPEWFDAVVVTLLILGFPLALVLALKDAAHPDFRSLLAAWKEEVEPLRELYIRSPPWNADRADIAAIEGDFPAAKRFYSAAIDAGWRNPFFVSRVPRKFLPPDAEFDALLSRMAELIDAERRSLGLPPFEAERVAEST